MKTGSLWCIVWQLWLTLFVSVSDDSYNPVTTLLHSRLPNAWISLIILYRLVQLVYPSLSSSFTSHRISTILYFIHHPLPHHLLLHFGNTILTYNKQYLIVFQQTHSTLFIYQSPNLTLTLHSLPFSTTLCSPPISTSLPSILHPSRLEHHSTVLPRLFNSSSLHSIISCAFVGWTTFSLPYFAR